MKVYIDSWHHNFYCCWCTNQRCVFAWFIACLFWLLLEWRKRQRLWSFYHEMLLKMEPERERWSKGYYDLEKEGRRFSEAKEPLIFFVSAWRRRCCQWAIYTTSKAEGKDLLGENKSREREREREGFLSVYIYINKQKKTKRL
jgi:hypothetical protein